MTPEKLKLAASELRARANMNIGEPLGFRCLELAKGLEELAEEKASSCEGVAPKDLVSGAYWYVVPGVNPRICEKRDGEDFVRFTNGSHQSWVKPGERFDGPIQLPAQ